MAGRGKGSTSIQSAELALSTGGDASNRQQRQGARNAGTIARRIDT